MHPIYSIHYTYNTNSIVVVLFLRMETLINLATTHVINVYVFVGGPTLI